jgi:hypothetical protein
MDRVQEEPEVVASEPASPGSPRKHFNLATAFEFGRGAKVDLVCAIQQYGDASVP